MPETTNFHSSYIAAGADVAFPRALADMQAQLQAMQQQLEDTQKKLFSAEIARAAEEAATERANERANAAEEQATHSQTILKRSKRRIARILEKGADLRRGCKELQTEIRDTKSEVENAKSQLARAQHSLTAAESKLDTISEQMIVARKHIAENDQQMMHALADIKKRKCTDDACERPAKKAMNRTDYRPWTQPSQVDFSVIDPEQSKRNYIRYGGENMPTCSDSNTYMRRKDSRPEMTPNSMHDALPSPQRSLDQKHSSETPIKLFGAPSEKCLQKARKLP